MQWERLRHADRRHYEAEDAGAGRREEPIRHYVAWQWEETRLFYSGTTAILPFLTHFRGLFSSDPYILPFQIMRGALWAALAVLIVNTMNAKRWESALAVALIFAGILSSGIGLFPNPYMPPMVRQSHFYELLSSMLLFGGVAGWTLNLSLPSRNRGRACKRT